MEALLQRIAGAAVKDWRADAWILERRDPDGWGRRRLEVTGEAGGPKRFEVDLGVPPAVRAVLPLALMPEAAP